MLVATCPASLGALGIALNQIHRLLAKPVCTRAANSYLLCSKPIRKGSNVTCMAKMAGVISNSCQLQESLLLSEKKFPQFIFRCATPRFSDKCHITKELVYSLLSSQPNPQA